MNLERIVEFQPAWDERSSDPGKGYGVHGVTLRFLLKGKRGATQFVLYTNWQLPHVDKERDNRPVDRDFPHLLCRPMPVDLGYHSYLPKYEGQERMGSCEVLPDAPGGCFYDGSGLDAERVYKVLLVEGDKGVWRELERYYKDLFGEEAE